MTLEIRFVIGFAFSLNYMEKLFKKKPLKQLSITKLRISVTRNRHTYKFRQAKEIVFHLIAYVYF